MQRFISILVFTLLISNAHAQNYWQQKVDYTIRVALNDENHTLRGTVKMVYHNQSPDALDKIYIHLWPNAYDSPESALGKQLYQDGNQLLKYGADSLKGNISELDFAINGQQIAWQLDDKNKDIAIIKLSEKLQPNQKLEISTPFLVKIPSGNISRLGHIGQSYQITQWYPKPAVYDKNGWHPIPYLNQGEFYSEYGSYDVYVTLPENYVVGATGDIQNESEIAFLNEKAKNDKTKIDLLDREGGDKNNFPPSSVNIKTIHYQQKNIHDFAWFADKRFLVLKDSVTLPESKKEVTTWAMFTPKNAKLWKKAPEYLKDAIHYYSLWNGDYPYEQVTAVDGTISAGGGMEYPNVTVIGNSGNADQLEVVIVHEVGHNWFYGILGTNEREHGWMDEGLNTLNEIRYIQTKYKGNKRLSDMILGGKFHMNDLDYHDQADLQYQLISRLGEDQAIETPSAQFSSINYGIVMYQKTGLVFHYLKSYLGDSLFDACMHAYFEKWKFKHPQPEDLKAIFVEKTGQNLDWFFDDLIKTRKRVDYKICRINHGEDNATIEVKNKGKIAGPVPVTTFGKDTLTHWVILDNKGKGSIEVNKDFSRAQIDPENHIPEINRNNNSWKSKGLFHKVEPVKLEFLIGDNEPHSSNLYWSPIVSFNQADRTMAGLFLHNYGVPFKQTQFYLAPFYSFGRKFVSGQAEINRTFSPSNCPGKFQIGIQGRSYKLEESSRGNDNYYAAVVPFFTRTFRDPQFLPSWEIDWINRGLLRYEEFDNSTTQTIGGLSKIDAFYTTPDHDLNIQIGQEYVQQLNRKDHVNRSQASLTYSYRYAKNKMKRWVEIRLYGGKIWQYEQSNPNQNNYALAMSGANGSQDLFFEDISFNRSPYQGLQSSIRQENMGGVKSTSEISSVNWLSSANLYFALPIPKINIGLFADYAFVANEFNSVNQYWDLGLGYRFRKIFRIYFPILESTNLSSSLEPLSYSQKVRFSIQWNLTNHPLRITSLL